MVENFCSFWGENTPTNFILSLSVTIVLFVIYFAGKKWTVKRLRQANIQSESQRYGLAITLINKVHGIFIAILFLYLGTQFLSLPHEVETLFDKIMIFALVIQIGLIGNELISFSLENFGRKQKEGERLGKTKINLLRLILLSVLWIFITLFLLDNLNFDIAALIAGLGIGGIAIALAVQNILGDVFASLSIMIDKPFVVGDFIIVDDYLGSVEYIGIKTTRLRSLGGEQIILSNSDLLKSRIRNYKQMNTRRVVFNLKVPYDTPHEKLESIPEKLKEIVGSSGNTRFDRAHFKEFGSYALDFEIVYHVLSSDYNVYMDIQQKINLMIYQLFAQEKIELAYPTTKRL